MKKKFINDERDTAQRRKVGSETCNLLMLGLLLSLLIQQTVLDAPFEQYAAEFICFFAGSFYIVVRNLALGNDFITRREKSRKWLIISSLVGGLTMTALLSFANYAEYGDRHNFITLTGTILIFFITSTALMFFGFSLLYTLNRKKQMKIAKKLDEEENDLD